MRRTAPLWIAAAALAGCGGGGGSPKVETAPPAKGTRPYATGRSGVTFLVPGGWQVKKLTDNSFLAVGGPNTTCRVDVGPLVNPAYARQPVPALKRLVDTVLRAGGDRRLVGTVEPVPVGPLSGATVRFRTGPEDVRAAFVANRKRQVVVNCQNATAGFPRFDRTVFLPLVRSLRLAA